MSSYFLRFIPLLAFFFFLISSIRKKNKIAFLIILIYFVSSFSSLFITADDIPDHDFESDNLFHFSIYTIIHCFFLRLTFFLKPFNNISELPRARIYYFINIVLGLGALFSIIYLMPYALESIVKSALDVRTDLVIGEEYVLPKSPLTTIAVGIPSFYFVFAFMFYVSIVKRKFILTILSLIGVLSFVVNVFTVSGRDGVFFAGFSLVIGFFFFEKVFTEKKRKRIQKIIYSILFLGILPVLKITIDRFSNDGNFSFLAFKKGIVNYFGMQPYIFSAWLKENTIFHGGVNNFPLFIKGNKVIFDAYYKGNFGTYLASFYSVNGYFSLIFLSLFFFVIFKFFLKRSLNYTPISKFFYFGLFLHFMVSGVFYFRLGNNGGNLFMLISFVMTLLFSRNVVLKNS